MPLAVRLVAMVDCVCMQGSALLDGVLSKYRRVNAVQGWTPWRCSDTRRRGVVNGYAASLGTPHNTR